MNLLKSLNLNEHTVEILQSLAVLVMCLLACFLLSALCFKAYIPVTGYFGIEPISFLTFIEGWYCLGYVLSFFWPLVYITKIPLHEWRSIFGFGLIHGFFGPFAIITGIPV